MFRVAELLEPLTEHIIDAVQTSTNQILDMDTVFMLKRFMQKSRRGGKNKKKLTYKKNKKTYL